MLFLTDSGAVYSWGYGEFGSLGLGGVIQSQVPQQLSNISNQVVNQVACGESHTLVLTNLHDLYVWGRGFNGALGMGSNITTISMPKYLSYFNKPPPDETNILKLRRHDKINYKNYVIQIACGTNHSLCINY